MIRFQLSGKSMESWLPKGHSKHRKQAFQLSWTFGNPVIHLGTWLASNICRIMLFLGAKMIAEEYVCKGASSIIAQLYKRNWFAS